jgi:hypothetical protein
MTSQGCYPDKALNVDSILEALSNSVRREMLNYFENSVNREVVQVEELATHLSNRIPSKNTKQLKIELHHQHLPRLAEEDWLEYDPRKGHIRYCGNDRAKQFIELVHSIF